MFPCRLIYGKEKAKCEVISRPFIDKVRECAGDDNKDNTYDSIKFQSVHRDIVCEKVHRYAKNDDIRIPPRGDAAVLRGVMKIYEKSSIKRRQDIGGCTCISFDTFSIPGFYENILKKM